MGRIETLRSRIIMNCVHWVCEHYKMTDPEARAFGVGVGIGSGQMMHTRKFVVLDTLSEPGGMKIEVSVKTEEWEAENGEVRSNNDRQQ